METERENRKRRRSVRDAVKDLQEIGRSLRELTVEDLKRHIDEQAMKEVSGVLERLRMKRRHQR